MKSTKLFQSTAHFMLIERPLPTRKLQFWTNTTQKNPNISDSRRKQQHNCKSANENFFEHKKLIDLCIEKLQFKCFCFCEMPPLKNVEQYWEKNEKIEKVNNLIASYYSDKPSFKISFLKANIRKGNNAVNKDNGSDSIGHNFLYFDNVHLNYQHDVLLLKNWLLSHLFLTTNCSICPKGF